MDTKLALDKNELLHRLGRYPVPEVQATCARLSSTIGDVNADGYDVEAHVLMIALDVFEKRNHRTPPAVSILARHHDRLWLVDLHDERIVAVSEAGAAMLGYKPHELVGRSYGHLRADTIDVAKPRRALEAHGSDEGATLQVAKDGTTVAIAYQARVVQLGDRALILVATKLLAEVDGAAGGSRYVQMPIAGVL